MIIERKAMYQNQIPCTENENREQLQELGIKCTLPTIINKLGKDNAL